MTRAGRNNGAHVVTNEESPVKQLDAYVGKTVLSAILVVLAVLLGIDALSALIDESEDISKSYTFVHVLQYVGLTIPARFYEYVPFAGLIGCLLGLGQLASSSELVVMRASGVSTLRLVWASMQPALLLVVVSALIGEYLAPRLEQLAESQRAVAISGHEGARTTYGLWNREGNTYMRFNAVEPGGVVHGVELYRFNPKGKLLSTLSAKRGSYQRDHWLLENVSQAHYTSWQATSSTQTTLRWDTHLTPALLSILVLPPQSLSIEDLYVYSRYLEEQGLDSDDYRLALWRKLFQPVGIASRGLRVSSTVFRRFGPC
ncbi:MAG: LPS export ABC transporter permease LptG [Gammaproteobacteria bacterium]|nr:MAG: LPS export ABC transporter permease LptG [Gammaproteobacteria bacterium]